MKSKVKFGIISDAHIPNIETIEKNLYNTLMELKKREVDLIIFAGDICDQNKKWAYDMYEMIFNCVYGKDRPAILAISGNHDLWRRVHVCDATAIENLKKYNNQADVNTHLVINGVHFIGVTSYPYFEGKDTENPVAKVSSQRGDYEYIKEWLETEVEKACEASDNPVFVVSHFPPKNTLPGSYEKVTDGNETLNEIFKKYPQIVSISGHTHFSLADNRSIHQRDFTSINAGSLHCVGCTQVEVPQDGTMKSFIGLEKLPADAYRKFPAFLYGEVNESEVKIERLFCNTGKKCGEDWTIPYPIKKESFVYTDSLFETAKGISFGKDDFVKVFYMDEKDYVSFNTICYAVVKVPAVQERIVGYKCIITNKNTGIITEKCVYSEVDDNFAYPKVFQVIPLPNLEYGDYNIKIFAIETYGKDSINYVEDNFTVKE